jgi:hypothetical protein
MKKIFTLFIALFFTAKIAQAQMPHDAIYMPKNTACFALSYGQSSWKQYWENSLKRENFNIGTHTTKTVMPMIAYGITDKLNLLVALPYITTSTNAGNLRGQKGVQDASAWLKYKLVENAKGISLHSILGASIPVGNYVPDFLPMSIGLQAKTASARLIGNYTHKSGAYITASASYIFRSNIKVDRDAYQTDNKVYNTNEVRVPNATDANLRAGYYKKGIQAELFLENFACVGGDNIRRNDMPFPTNNMRANTMGFYGKYQPKNIGANVRISQVTNGINVGKTLSYSIGILYQMNFTKKASN